jgi:plasmid maintenance system antidote protein VapI
LTITALRLARHVGTSEQFWMGLQADYDLDEARKGLGRQIDAIERAAAWR